MNDLPMRAMHLARELEQGHYSMSEAVDMIRKLALALDDVARAARKAAE